MSNNANPLDPPGNSVQGIDMDLSPNNNTNTATSGNNASTSNDPSSVSDKGRSNSPMFSGSTTLLAGDDDNSKNLSEPSTAAVLAFLKSRGLSKAVGEFRQFLEKEKEIDKIRSTSSGTSPDDDDKETDGNEEGEGGNAGEKKDKQNEGGKEEEDFKDMMVDPSTSIVSRPELKFNIATGGGLGYDADCMPLIKFDHPPLFSASSPSGVAKVTGGWEIKRFLHSFNTLQIWILNQPDDPSHSKCTLPRWNPPSHIKSLLQEPLHVIPPTSMGTNGGRGRYGPATYPPPSIKPELLSICFPVLVHSYCTILESGFDDIARELWNTWKSLYVPLYPQDTKDLDHLTTTKQMKQFYNALVTHSDNMTKVRNLKIKDVESQQMKEKLMNWKKTQKNINVVHQIEQKLLTLEQDIIPLQKRVREIEQVIQSNQTLLQKYPFLSRMKNKKYQIQISAHTWRKLAEFLTREELAPMYGILQLHCRVIVEARDPMPFTLPGAIDEEEDSKDKKDEQASESSVTNTSKRKGDTQIQWAAPLHPSSRAAEMGEDHTSVHAGKKSVLPFPKYYPSKSDQNDKDLTEQESEARDVAFNRALRINGFRRLEALEIAQEHESGMRAPLPNKKISFPGSALHQQSQRSLTSPANPMDSLVDPLSPSIFMGTFCSGKSMSSTNRNSSSALTISSNTTTTPHSTPRTSTLEESGIGITCASMSPIDGRRIAIGCEDAAVRIFALDGSSSSARQKGTKGSIDNNISPGIDISDSEMILIGHKNGSPVFDVNWNRDGRNLLSAGGDGSIRLWDTMAVGPYGTLSNVQMTRKGMSTTITSKTDSKNINGIDPVLSGGPPNTNVPGSKPESLVQKHGAALAVYQGHTINTPVWSCKFSPSGYYFASTGADCTARIWTTDFPKPVRILAGHYSSVNCITWHPNCNYVLSGSDDKTIRMWDVQTGKCVRVLAGSYSGVNVVRVSPSGRYAAAADLTGVVGLWDLNSGRKVNEFRGHVGEIHGMSYSACGTALATGGDDCAVKLWDVRGAGVNSTVPEVAKAFDYSGIYGEVKRNTEIFEPPGMRKPVKIFQTKQTMILDLQFTKRNLLMSVGKFVASIGGQ